MARQFSKVIRAVSLAAMLAVIAGCGSAEDRAKTYYESGQELLEKKDFAKAAVEFRNALKLKEDYADAWYGMAKIEENAQNWGKVFGNLNRVLEIDPNHAPAMADLARLQLLSGQEAEGLVNIDKALAIEPQNPSYMAVKAAIFLKRKDFTAAAQEAERALKIDPDNADATSIIVSILLDSKDFAGALAKTEAALAKNTGNLGLHLLRLRSADGLGDAAKQETAVRDLIAAFPDNRDFRKILLSFLVKNGRTADAETELRNIMAANPEDTENALDLVRFIGGSRGTEAARAELVTIATNAKTPFPYWMALADLDFASGQQDEAIKLVRLLDTEQGITDNGIAARLKLADMLINTKQFVEAKTFIEEILTNDAQNVDALLRRGALNIEQDNLQGAIADLRAAFDLDGKNPKVRGVLAVAYERSGSIELADKEYLEAVRLSNYDVDTSLKAVEFLVRRGSDDRAELLLKELMGRTKNDTRVLTMMGRLLLKRQDWKGVEEIAKLLKDSGDTTLSDRLLSGALIGQKRYDDAVKMLDETAKKDAGNMGSATALVMAYLAGGDAASAETYVNGLLQQNPEDATAHLLMGSVQVALQKFDEATKSFETSIAKQPDSPAGYLALARVQRQQGNTDLAIKTLLGGIDKTPDKAQLRMSLASIYEASEKIDDAVAQYELIIADSPGALLAVNNLASLLTDYRTDAESHQRAATLAAVLRDSPVAHFRETLGWALVQKGDVKAGLPILERAITELAAVPAAQYHLGVAYLNAGDKILAAKHLKLAQTLEKNETRLALIKDALAKAESVSQ